MIQLDLVLCYVQSSPGSIIDECEAHDMRVCEAQVKAYACDHSKSCAELTRVNHGVTAEGSLWQGDVQGPDAGFRVQQGRSVHSYTVVAAAVHLQHCSLSSFGSRGVVAAVVPCISGSQQKPGRPVHRNTVVIAAIHLHN